MRRRILATIVAVAAMSVTAFFVPAALAMHSRAQRTDLLELQREAAIIAARLSPAGPFDLAALTEGIDHAGSVAIYGVDGTRLDGVGPAAADEIVRRALRGEFTEGTSGPELVIAAPLRFGPSGPGLVVRISEPRSAGDRRFLASVTLLGAAGIGVLGVAAVTGTLLARRLSRPVEHLRRWATSLGNDSDRPLPPPSGVDEFDDLRASMVAASERISELLRRERSFSSHVAHQLRTPVAAMRVALEAELQTPRPDATTVLHESIGALDRLESTITSLLTLARHDERPAVSCDVRALVFEQVATWRGAVEAKGRSLTITGAPAVARVDAESLRHIVDVLLDNALHHGRGLIAVDVRLTDRELVVDVTDEGTAPVIDPFSELRSGPNHGIGLRLARSLAESDGGSLRVVEAPTTTFRLTMPVRHSPPDASSATN